MSSCRPWIKKGFHAMNSSPLPFDALRPFKSRPEEFEPRDTLPWASHAVNFLRCRSHEGFPNMRPFAAADACAAWIAEQIGLPPRSSVLDIGCGPGMYSNRLAARGYQVTGIDIAQDFLDYAAAEAAEHGWPARYENISLFDLPYRAEFDLALLLQSVVNLVASSELDRILAGIWRALRPGGHFIGEFLVASAAFLAAGPTITEAVSLLRQSPWSDQPHAWMERNLTFPESNQLVTHHLIFSLESGQAHEHWSRYQLQSIARLTDLLTGHGFIVQAVFGQSLGRDFNADDPMAMIWLRKPAD
jgi:SAM-dependent methyltransferase